MNDLFLFGDNGELKDAIEFLLTKLPSEVSAHIQEHCIVIVINDSLDGFYVPARLIRGKSVIALNYGLFKKNYQKFTKTFFHEVAHHWLKHIVLFGKNDSLEMKQEEEAELLVSRWFALASSRSSFSV